MEHSIPMPKRVRRGDAGTFALVFEEYQQRICRYLCSLVSDPDLAEDLAQQTFIKAYEALERGSPPQNMHAWLYTIATNNAFSALRRRRLITWLPFHAHAESAPSPGPDTETQAGDSDLLAQALSRLPRDDAACLLLRFQHDLSYEELAQVLGTSAPAARMRVSRARSVFREIYLQLQEEVSR